MHETIKRMANAFVKQREQRRRACAVFTALAILVSLSTTYLLVQPANTMAVDYICGLETHEHSEECYRLICGYDDAEKEETGGAVFSEQDGEATENPDEMLDSEASLEEEEIATEEQPSVEEETSAEERQEEDVIPPAKEEEPPVTEDPSVEEEPAAEESVVEEPAVTPSVSEVPVQEEPSEALEESTPVVEAASDAGSEVFSGTVSMAMVMYTNGQETSEPAVEEPVVEEPVVEEPVVEEPVVEEPVVEEPVVEEPVVEEPVVEEPVVEEPVVEEPGDEEIAEEPSDETVVEEESEIEDAYQGSSADKHIHTSDCYELICGLPEHEHSENCMSLMNFLTDLGDLPEGYTNEYSVFGEGYTVAVFAPDGALPEGAKLVATLLEEGDDAHTTAQQTLEAMATREIEVNVGGVMAEEVLQEVPETRADAEISDVPEEEVKEPVEETELVESREKFVVEESEQTETVLTASLVHNDNAPAETENQEPEQSEESGQAGEVTPYWDESVNTFRAFDIYFELDGKEIEPSKPVFVYIDAQELLPEVIPETVQIFHLKEEVNATEESGDNQETERESPVIESVEIVADISEDTGSLEILENEADAAVSVTSLFAVDSFSIFVVSGVNGTQIQKINSGAVYPMTVNGEVYLQWAFDTTAQQNAADKRGIWSIADGTDLIEIQTYPCVKIEGEETTLTDPGAIVGATYQYWFVKVKALKSEQMKDAQGNLLFKADGSPEYRKATLKYTFYAEKDNTVEVTDAKNTYTVQIEVADQGFWIEDKIATTGCLVPAGSFLSSASGIESFRWSRSDKGVIASDSEALDEKYVVENGVNVAIDKGGITDNNRTYKTYTVEGLDANGNVVTIQGENGTPLTARASFTVKYGMEVINGGFEDPVVPDIKLDANGVWTSGSIHRQYANGHEGIYWMTTGAGGNRPPMGTQGFTQMLGHDIEIFTDKGGYMAKTYSGIAGGLNYIGTSNGLGSSVTFGTVSYTNNGTGVDDNHQAAELNCEAYGALYQDVLTNPGATLSWQVRHAARYGTETAGVQHPEDHMCIIIMSTEDARHVVTKSDIDKLLDAAGYRRSETHSSIDDCNCGLSNDGGIFTTTLDSGVTVKFQIWDSAANNTTWSDKAGSYEVPAGQYSTRFFFAAAVSVTNNLAGGNFIDDVEFSESMPYAVEYYTQADDGSWVLRENLTRNGRDTIDSKIFVDREHSSLVPEYTPSKAELNGRSLIANSNGEYSFTLRPLKDGTPVLRLYYIKSGIAVTKIVEGLDESYTEEQLAEMMADYTVYIDLYSDSAYTNQVATAEIPFGTGALSGTEMFMDATTGKQFAPSENTTYYAREREIPDIAGYYSTSTQLPAVEIAVGSPAVAVATVTNTYVTGAVLPSTGGIGTNHFTTLGIALMLGAGVLLLDQRRRREGTSAS